MMDDGTIPRTVVKRIRGTKSTEIEVSYSYGEEGSLKEIVALLDENLAKD